MKLWVSLVAGASMGITALAIGTQLGLFLEKAQDNKFPDSRRLLVLEEKVGQLEDQLCRLAGWTNSIPIGYYSTNFVVDNDLVPMPHQVIVANQGDVFMRSNFFYVKDSNAWSRFTNAAPIWSRSQKFDTR